MNEIAAVIPTQWWFNSMGLEEGTLDEVISQPKSTIRMEEENGKDRIHGEQSQKLLAEEVTVLLASLYQGL